MGPSCDLAQSLTPVYQKQLLEVCPFLQESIDNPEETISYMYDWYKIGPKVGNMDPK